MIERQINVEAFLIVQQWRETRDPWLRDRIESRFWDKLKHNWPQKHSGNGIHGIRAYMEAYDAEC